MLASEGGDRMGSKYPTGALAVLELDTETWADAGKGGGALVAFTTPKQLGPG